MLNYGIFLEKKIAFANHPGVTVHGSKIANGRDSIAKRKCYVIYRTKHMYLLVLKYLLELVQSINPNMN